MSRLIDADKLKKPIYAEDDNCTGDGMTYDEMAAYNDGIDIVWRRIESAPTVDVVPVVHGEWIVHNPDNPLTIYGECPFCHEEVGRKYNYCPNCGAKMHGLESANEH